MSRSFDILSGAGIAGDLFENQLVRALLSFGDMLRGTVLRCETLDHDVILWQREFQTSCGRKAVLYRFVVMDMELIG